MWFCLIRFGGGDAYAHEKRRHFSRRPRLLLRMLLIKRRLYPPPKYGKSFNDNLICDEWLHMNDLTKDKDTLFVREKQESVCNSTFQGHSQVRQRVQEWLYAVRLFFVLDIPAGASRYAPLHWLCYIGHSGCRLV